MDTVSPPQTRSRSRSKTPFTSTITERDAKDAAENGERAEKKRSPVRKEPTVQTIREEDESTQTPAKKSKRETRSSNVSPGEGSSTGKTPPSASTTVKVTTTTTKVVTRGETAVKESSETLKRGIVNQKEFNQGLEGSHKKISTPRNNKTTGGGGGSAKISINGDLSDHIAYKEYHEAGEYWNKYPKTDYTYSKLSPHRREIAPGVIAMPNMSRKSLEKHAERVKQMVLNNPEQESYIRARFESSRLFASSSRTASSGRALHYDSGDDEIDLTQFDRRKQRIHTQTIFRQIYTRIITTIITSWHFISRPFARSAAEKRSTFYANTQLSAHAEHRGLLRRVGSAISSSFLYVFQRIYLLIASILLVDTWLLQTRTESGRHKKKFLWFLILLLPLLLMGVWGQAEEEQKSRILSVLPLSLGWLPSVFTSSSSAPWSWSDYLPTLNLFSFPSSSSSSSSSQESIQQHLTAEEFTKLLAHIDQYIETVVSKRTSSEDLNLLVAKIVRENIVTYKYELTEKDIERIVAIILDRLQNDHVINQELINRITLSVREGFQGESPDEIILRILQSNHLTQLIDQRMQNHIVDTSKYDDLIGKLSMEISKIKIDLSNLQNTDEDFRTSVESMRKHQELLADQLYNFKQENDQRLNQLLNEVDIKIATMSDKHFVEIDKQIRRVLVQIFNIDQTSGQNIDESDLKNWIKNVFVAKEYLEARLGDLQRQFSGDVEVEIQRSAGILMQNITDTLRAEILAVLAAKTSSSSDKHSGSVNLSEDHVRRIVQEALAVYDADKTGLVDYALESAGGQILSTRCTESYHTKTAQISVFGIPLWYPSNTPRTAISPSVQPGNCWAFQGFPGFLVLKLNLPVLVTGFTMEHIPKALAPNGQIDSAPKGFSVWGLLDESDQDPLLFGKYIFEDNGLSLQYFPVQNLEISRPHQIVELRIESNHDNPNYTCLYRFRVHGTPQS